MKFIKLEELKIRKFQNLINDVSSDDDTILEELELEAIGIIVSAINSRYDTDYIFSRIGTERSSLMKGIVIDIMMCNLWLRTNSSEQPSSLEVKCEKQMEYLDKIQNGTRTPDLQLKDSTLQPTAVFSGSSEAIFNNINNID